MKTLVITGGPCSGKTSALAKLKTYFADVDKPAVFVKEAGTDLILSGISPAQCGSMRAFQTKVAALQITRETEAQKQARTLEANQPRSEALVICDRGIADGAAYVDPDEYVQVLTENGLAEGNVFGRYDAVFCLESTAQMNNSSYSVQNNTARSENPEEAAALDKRTYAAWSAHPQFYLIQNEVSFAAKFDALLAAIKAFLAA